VFSKENFKTLVLATAVMLGVAAILFWALKYYTRHDEKIIVPDVIGKAASIAIQELEQLDLVPVITDTIFVADKKVNTVIEQSPDKDSEVKSERKIYLVISSNKAPMVELPDLKDLSEREAKAQLTARGFKVGKVIQVPQFGGVIGLNYQGKSVEPRTRVPKGSTIDIRIGRFTSDSDTTRTNLTEIE